MSDKHNDFIKYAIENGATIVPIAIAPEEIANSGNSSQFNPSICNYKGKMTCSLRYADYVYFTYSDREVTINDRAAYYFRDDVTHSSLYVGSFDGAQMYDMSKINTSFLEDASTTQWKGIEDCRLVVWDGKLYASGTARYDNEDWITNITLCELEEHNGAYTLAKHYVVPSDEDNTKQCEKNWMPVEGMPYTWVKWASNPMVIAKYDISSGKTQTYNTEVKCKAFDGLRGSTQLVMYNGAYYAVLHNAIRYDSQRECSRYYMFCVAKFDDKLNMVACSDMYHLDSNFQVEFISGMAINNGKLYLSYALEDTNPYVMAMDPNVLLGDIL